MDFKTILASILISAIGALGAWAASRSSARAAIANAKTTADANKETSRAEAEKEAYDRARKMDIETIERQDKEIDEIREQNKLLKEQNEHLNSDVKRIDADNTSLHDENRRVMEDNARLRAELRAMRIRVVRLERGIDPKSEEPVVERREDIPPWYEGSEEPTSTDPYIEFRGDADGDD